jgi:signal peptidase I
MASPLDGTISRIILVVALSVVPYVLLRALVVQPFSIPSGSMMPTLEVGDYMVATKFPYGFKNFSLPFGRFLPKFSVASTPPERAANDSRYQMGYVPEAYVYAKATIALSQSGRRPSFRYVE